MSPTSKVQATKCSAAEAPRRSTAADGKVGKYARISGDAQARSKRRPSLAVENAAR